MDKIIELGCASKETKGQFPTNVVQDGFKIMEQGVRYQAGAVLNKTTPAPL
jgi:hypothetical protein